MKFCSLFSIYIQLQNQVWVLHLTKIQPKLRLHELKYDFV